MASLYQDFIIQVDETAPTKRILSLKAVWYSNFITKLAQVTEISIDGGVWLPMVANAATQYTYNLVVSPVGIGESYNIKIREEGVRIFDLGNIFVSSIGNECPNLSGNGVSYFIYPSTRLANDGSDRPLLIQAGQSGDFSTNEHSIDGGTTFKAADVNGITNWTQAEVDAVPSPLQIEINTIGDDLALCPKIHVANLGWPPTGMQLSETHTNPTTNGGSDGSITIIVANGSGDFSFLWNDANTTNPRTGLIAGVYSVQVTDNITAEVLDLNNISLTEPAEEVTQFPNTLATSSPINPIRFKENAIGEDLPLENYNFCEQPTQEMTKLPTYETFNIQDQTRLQFISDFAGNNVKKINIDTGAEENLSLELVEDNISGGATFNASLQGLFFEGNAALKLGNDQSVSNPYPNPSVGDIITISNGGSYDGSYAIIGITKDETEDSIWINGVFTENVPVTVTFVSDIRFNVYELLILFVDWGIGNFRLEFETSDNVPNTVTKLISENISVKASTPNTLLFVYSNNDSAFGVVWGTGIVMRKRHEGFFVKVSPTRDSTNFRNSNDRPSILNAYVRNNKEYKVHLLPWFSVQRLALIFTCDNMQINGKNMFVEELPDTEQSDSRFLLSNLTFIAEEIGWLDDQNTHDIGDTSEVSIVIGGDSDEVLGV